MVFDRSAKLAFIVACLMLVVGRLGFQYAAHALNVYLQKEPVALRAKFPNIPDRIGEWRKVGVDEVLDKAMEESLGTNDYLDRWYAPEGFVSRGQLKLHLSYYTGMIDAVPHVPDRCLVAAGFDAQSLAANFPLTLDASSWQTDSEHINRKTGTPYPFVDYVHPFLGQKLKVRMPLGQFELRTTEFGKRDEPGQRVFAGYLFVANGCTTPQPEAIRLLAFDRTDKFAYYCKVQFTMVGTRELTREKFLGAVSGFLDDLLPELMRCLPDWAEVEASEQTKATASAPASLSVASKSG